MRRFLAAAAGLLVLLAAPLAGRADPSSPPPAAVSPALASPSSSAPTVGQRIVFFGDSITWGGLVAWPDRLPQELAFRICGQCPAGPVMDNQGIGGQSLASGTNPPPLTQTAPPIITTLHPGDIVVVAEGMNDLWSYPGDAVWTTAYVQLVASIQATGAHVLVAQITPLASAQWPRETLRQTLNQWLVDHFGASMTLRYPDVLHCQLAGASCSGQTWIDPQYGWPDGIHVNAGGYAVMADLLYSRLTALGWLVTS